MLIKRDLYLDRLNLRKHNGLIKVITGIRRSGKSFLMNKLFYGSLKDSGTDDAHIIRFAFDDYENKQLRNPELFYPWLKKQIKDSKMHYVLLDEVQLLEDFEAVLNGLMRMDNIDIYVTGSNSRFLSTDVLTEFRGRGDEVHIMPLSFAEFCSAFNGTPEDAWQEYYTYGGLPYLLNLKTEEQKTGYLQRLFQETYIRDIIDRNKLRNTSELSALLDILSSSTGSYSSIAKLAATFKSAGHTNISPVTLSSYTRCLEDAYIISKAQRYDVKGRKYIGSPVKYYFEDVGLRNARLNFRQLEENHVMENIVYNELRVRGYSVDVGVIETREKDSSGKSLRRQLEVDFVANLGNRRYYIQSAFTMYNPEKEQQEKRSLKLISDSFKKIVVVRETILPRRDENGILTIGLLPFLLNSNSLEI